MICYEDLQKNNAHIETQLREVFSSVLASGRFVFGPCCEKFERAFAGHTGNKYCAGVGSGLDALILSIGSLGLRGMEIIVPANTYVVTVQAIIQSGNIPVLVDPDKETYNIDPDAIQARIGRRTGAILPVHLYGKPCDMDAIMKISKKNRLAVVEDCSHAHGARYKGRHVGSFGDAGAFSFYPTKNLGALGDGGGIVTNRRQVHKVILTMRNYGFQKKDHHVMIGLNSRLDEIQAAFLSIKLRMLDRIVAHKKRLARIYLRQLKDDFIKPAQHKDYCDAWHIFPIRHPKRDALKAYLKRHGVETKIHYPVPPYRQPSIAKRFRKERFPVSDLIHKTILSLPLSYAHSADDVMKVAEIMNRF